MSRHAPGPWEARHLEHFDGGDGVEVVDATGETVVDSQPYYPHALDPENAPVIAAAPEMLAAISFLLDCSAPLTSQQRECWISLREAREKATGKKP